MESILIRYQSLRVVTRLILQGLRPPTRPTYPVPGNSTVLEGYQEMVPEEPQKEGGTWKWIQEGAQQYILSNNCLVAEEARI